MIAGEEIKGYMSERECGWLMLQAKKMKSVVEIGSFKGMSTSALLECPGPVYAIDTFVGSVEHQQLIQSEGPTYEAFLRNVGHHRNLRVFPMKSQDAAVSRLIPAKVDMVFIDGAHDWQSVMTDLECWAHRAVRLLSGHDFNMTGVKDALKEFFPDGGLEYFEDIWFKELA
jgi:hypothetical protein